MTVEQLIEKILDKPELLSQITYLVFVLGLFGMVIMGGLFLTFFTFGFSCGEYQNHRPKELKEPTL